MDIIPMFRYKRDLGLKCIRYNYYFLFLVIFSFKTILQNKECADENNTELFADVSHEDSLTIQDTGESNGLENPAGD